MIVVPFPEEACLSSTAFAGVRRATGAALCGSSLPTCAGLLANDVAASESSAMQLVTFILTLSCVLHEGDEKKTSKMRGRVALNNGI